MDQHNLKIFQLAMILFCANFGNSAEIYNISNTRTQTFTTPFNIVEPFSTAFNVNKSNETFSSKVSNSSCCLQIQKMQFQMQRDYQRLEMKLDVAKAEIQSIKTSIGRHSGRTVKLGVPDQQKIAFFTTMTSSQTIPDNQTIRFDNIVTNIGSGYNKYTGAFTCPREGLYQLWLTILATPGHMVDVEMVKNGDVITRGYAKDLDSQYVAHTNYAFDSGTALAIVNLEVGDVIYVRCLYCGGGNNNLFGLHYSHFGGHLIN